MITTVIASMEIHPDDIAKVVEAAKPLIVESHKEDGCLYYEFALDISKPNIIRVAEWWKSAEDLKVHLKKPHVQAFLGVMGQVRVLSNMSKQFSVSSVGDVEY